ncbi:MAG: cupin domain-containing protein [Clostridia bacterium]|nr:cupin domain-containing protein [Clostridia bacterium]
MIVRNLDAAAVPADPGVTRKVLAHAPGMMAAEMRFEQGAVGALHAHPHEQIGYVVGGRFLLTLDGETVEIRAGDTYHVRPGVMHGVKALESGVLLDVFAPRRDDFL